MNLTMGSDGQQHVTSTVDYHLVDEHDLTVLNCEADRGLQAMVWEKRNLGAPLPLSEKAQAKKVGVPQHCRHPHRHRCSFSSSHCIPHCWQCDTLHPSPSPYPYPTPHPTPYPSGYTILHPDRPPLQAELLAKNWTWETGEESQEAASDDVPAPKTKAAKVAAPKAAPKVSRKPAAKTSKAFATGKRGSSAAPAVVLEGAECEVDNEDVDIEAVLESPPGKKPAAKAAGKEMNSIGMEGCAPGLWDTCTTPAAKPLPRHLQVWMSS